MNSAIADTDVLRRLDEDGDRFEIFRDVDFNIICPDTEKAEAIAGFLTDYEFGSATVTENPKEVLVVIHMPVTQQVILCISGFLNCVANLYSSELEGWEQVFKVHSAASCCAGRVFNAPLAKAL